MTALRPIEPADVEALERWKTDPAAAGDHQWFGFMPRRLREQVEHGTLIGEEGGSLAVVDDDGALVGDVSWRRRVTGPGPHNHSWNLGIMLLPEHRGRGHGTAAQRQLAAYLFAHTAVERVEADTDVANVAEQRALEKAGFTREGVLRRAQFREGAWHDMVLYSKLRGER